jgi:hypothetical protein
MRNLKVFLAVGAGLAAAVVAACSSSSSVSPVTPTADAGDDSSTGDDDSSVSTACFPIGTLTCNAKAGETCCFNASNLSGTCVQQASCKQSIQVACSGGSSCGTGQKCCADLGGTSIGALEDAGLGALGLDAGALSAEAGIAGLTSALAGFSVNVSCAATCAANSIQECDTTADCSGGAICSAVGALAGDAGAGIDAGALPSGFGMYAAEFSSIKLCIPPAIDGGTAVTLDAGSTPVEAGVTDAAADAPSEAAQ